MNDLIELEEMLKKIQKQKAILINSQQIAAANQMAEELVTRDLRLAQSLEEGRKLCDEVDALYIKLTSGVT